MSFRIKSSSNVALQSLIRYTYIFLPRNLGEFNGLPVGSVLLWEMSFHSYNQLKIQSVAFSRQLRIS